MIRKVLAAGCFLAVGVGVGAGVWGGVESLREDPGARHLREGDGLLRRREWEGAAGELRLALSSSDVAVGGAARHNLGLALLWSSLEGDGGVALSQAREAVSHLEEALRRVPGLPSGGWNLELALRRVRELEGSGAGEGDRQAERLLASFGVLDEGGRGEVLRARLEQEGEGRSPPREKGPPW